MAANSYVDQVVRNHKGLPVTLCALVCECALRLGTTFVCMVGLSGHVVPRCCRDTAITAIPDSQQTLNGAFSITATCSQAIL